MNRPARSKRKKGDGISPPYVVRDELYRLVFPREAPGFPHAVPRSSGECRCSHGESANDDARDTIIYHPVFLNG
jgi:hypothetical protein